MWQQTRKRAGDPGVGIVRSRHGSRAVGGRVAALSGGRERESSMTDDETYLHE